MDSISNPLELVIISNVCGYMVIKLEMLDQNGVPSYPIHLVTISWYGRAGRRNSHMSQAGHVGNGFIQLVCSTC